MSHLNDLKKIAESGDAEAQFKLGNEYIFGKDTPKDHSEAFKWYQYAAEQGNIRAQFNLGYMYRNGEGVSSDYVQAYKWYTLAAIGGNENCRKLRDLVAKRISPNQLAEADRLVREWEPKSWQQLKSPQVD